MAEAEHLPQEKEDILKRICDSLECSICLEQYTDPRVLNCQHTFCAKCLKQHVADSDIIRCPLCNNESVKPAEGIEGLKLNFFIVGVIEDVIGKKSKLPKGFNLKRKCGSCEDDYDAISHCEDCECDLCSDCHNSHKKLKALKDHKQRPLPTEEDLLEQIKVESDTMIEIITHDIHDKEAELNEKISPLRMQIREIEKTRDAEQNKLRESHRQLLVKIDEYVQQLSNKINSSAAERLGNMPQELAAYEQRLKIYKTLKQQGWMISNIQIHKRVERCQELMQQIRDFQQRSQAAVYNGGNEVVVTAEFVPSGVTQSQLLACLVRCLGYVKHLPSRLDRKVEIRKEVNIAADMKDRAIQAMHDTLDHIGMYPTTYDSLVAVADWTHDHMNKKYPQQKWSVIVGNDKGFTCLLLCNSVLTVVIDSIMFTLFTKQ